MSAELPDTSSQAPAIGVDALIIDATGFSGGIFGENLLTLDNRRAGRWAMSLDSVAIPLMHSQFESTNFSGELEVPAFDKPLVYNCHIQPGGLYAFSVALQDTVTMSAMSAMSAIINIGSWALSANTSEDQPVLAGFPLQLNEVSMVQDTVKKQVAFGLTKMNTAVNIIEVLSSIKVPALIMQRTNDIEIEIKK